MVSQSEGELFESKIDPCGSYGRRAMADSALCMKCGKWVQKRCAKIELPVSWQCVLLVQDVGE